MSPYISRNRSENIKGYGCSYPFVISMSINLSGRRFKGYPKAKVCGKDRTCYDVGCDDVPEDSPHVKRPENLLFNFNDYYLSR
jgi:hypothetical protein